MIDLKLDVHKVTVLQRSESTDIVVLNIADPEFKAWPNMQYSTHAKIECQQGRGIDFCRNVLKLEYDQITITDI